MATIFMGTTPVIGLTVTENGSALDIHTATVKQITFKKPDNSIVTVTAAFTTDGSDGKIQYTAAANFLDHPGTYQYQGVITLPDSATPWKTEIVSFNVAATLA
jgi:hypothetical protein